MISFNSMPSRNVESVGHMETKDPMVLTTAIREGLAGAVELLLDQGVDVNYQCPRGKTALMWAAAKGNIACMRRLIECGAQLHLKDAFDQTALMYATLQGELEVVKFLLDEGAEIDVANRHGMTALMCAASKGNLLVVKKFIDKDAKVDQVNQAGNSALLLATRAGHADVVKALTDKDIKIIDQQDKSGWTALVMAASLGREDIVKTLLDAGADGLYRLKIGYSALSMAKYLNDSESYRKIKELFLKKYGGELITNERMIKTIKIAAAAFLVPERIEVGSFERQGACFNHVGDLFLKQWNAWRSVAADEEHTASFEMISRLLELSVKRKRTAEELALQYATTKSVILPTGHHEHATKTILWHDYLVYINRGELAHVITGILKTVEMRALPQGKLEDRDFLSEYISKAMKTNAVDKATATRYLQETFKHDYFRSNTVTKLLERVMALPPQRVGNCSWASFEGAILVLMCLEALKRRGLLPLEALTKESLQEVKAVIIKEHGYFSQFMKWTLGKIKEKYSKLPQERQEQDILDAFQRVLL